MTANVFPAPHRSHRQDEVGESRIQQEFSALVRRQAGRPSRAALDEFLARHGLTSDAVGPLLAELAASYAPANGAEPTAPAAPIPEQRSALAPDSVRASSQSVADAGEDLVGDWLRTGRLTNEQVATTAADHELSGGETAELYDLLRDSGVSLERPDVTGGRRPVDRSVGELPVGDALGRYLKQIGRYRLIDAGREVELWSAISQGAQADAELSSDRQETLDQQARLREISAVGRRAHEELVCANLRLVVSIARGYQVRGLDLADLVQFGNLGVMRAADKFDGSKGYKFSTYATWWIRQSITRGLADTGRTIRLPVHMAEQVDKVRRAQWLLTARLDREPTTAEIAEKAGLEPGAVDAIRDLDRPMVSLDAPIGTDGDSHLADFVVDRGVMSDPVEWVTASAQESDVDRALRATLSEREYEIVCRRYGIRFDAAQTLDEIGAALGVTRERIRQIVKKALGKLRDSDTIAPLYSYLSDGPAPSEVAEGRGERR
ncbi:RNA polymerase principal sigma factor HrdB [Actinocatenispora thailandica]|uniref:RNA polymerase principal sigma factor HrdB n=1 Tax=Actinocatenispora thailandica TaxID=227318 RepID=A0A7R7DTA4_9ACTN|nr:sigma-70 family RNA polymerase sigma factor [Actinocatenispora thailandica]BCJ37157.1 RNA polymerase principal sigma factor HrdB [Actinocatenispora thailandica]